jgi:hypothetical protein
MTKSDEKFIADWEAHRKSGKWKYFLLYGGTWGGVMFLIHGLFDLHDHSFREAFFSMEAGFYLLMMLLVGTLLYAPSLWVLNDYSYRSRKKKQDAAKAG